MGVERWAFPFNTLPLSRARAVWGVRRESRFTQKPLELFWAMTNDDIRMLFRICARLVFGCNHTDLCDNTINMLRAPRHYPHSIPGLIFRTVRVIPIFLIIQRTIRDVFAKLRERQQHSVKTSTLHDCFIRILHQKTRNIGGNLDAKNIVFSDIQKICCNSTWNLLAGKICFGKNEKR